MANRSGSRDRGVDLLASRWLNGEEKLKKRCLTRKCYLDVRENVWNDLFATEIKEKLRNSREKKKKKEERKEKS